MSIAFSQPHLRSHDWAPALTLAPQLSTRASSAVSPRLSLFDSFDWSSITSLQGMGMYGMPSSIGPAGMGFMRHRPTGMSGMWGVSYQAPSRADRMMAYLMRPGGSAHALGAIAHGARSAFAIRNGFSSHGGIPEVRNYRAEMEQLIAKGKAERAANKTKEGGEASESKKEKTVSRTQRIADMTEKGIAQQDAEIFYDRFLKGKKASQQKGIVAQIFTNEKEEARSEDERLQVMAFTILDAMGIKDKSQQQRAVRKVMRAKSLSALPVEKS